MNQRYPCSHPAFTLIELLIVISIIATLVAMIVPALSGARSAGQTIRCLSNLHQQAEMTLNYCQANDDFFPTRTATSATGGGSVYGAAMPTRTLLRFDHRPVDVLTCPQDRSTIRDYPAGDAGGENPGGLGIADYYGMPRSQLVRFSYGVNNMTGIVPVTDDEKLIFNSHLGAYKHPTRTLLYADCAWINARGSNRSLNDEPRLKGRVANAAAPNRMDTLADIPLDYGRSQSNLRRHPKGSGIAFMDLHGEALSQEDCFSKLIYSWTEK